MTRRIFLLIASALILSSCASTPEEPNRFGHFHDFPYQAPDYVSQTDEVECAHEANAAAWDSTKDVSSAPAVLFGALGAMVTLGTATHTADSTYERVFKACLRRKGYDIAD